MKEPLISVLVPVYNVEPYIDRCIGSIVAQTYKNLEIILVVQPSTDLSVEKAKKWEKKDSRIVLINQSTADLATARNTLIKNAKGKYVSFVDSDDFIDSIHIKTLYEIAVNQSADIVQSMVYAFINSNNIPKIDFSFATIEILSGRDYIYKAFSGVYGSEAGVLQTKLYRTEMYRNIIFPEMRVCEDTATTYKIMWNAKKVAIYSGQTYYYQSKRQDSIIHIETGKLRMMKDGLIAQLEQLDFFKIHDMQIYYIVAYNICNSLVRLKWTMKKNKHFKIDNERVNQAIHNHKQYKRIVINSSFSLKKKIVIYLGYYFPFLFHYISNVRQKYRYNHEWKSKS